MGLEITFQGLKANTRPLFGRVEFFTTSFSWARELRHNKLKGAPYIFIETCVYRRWVSPESGENSHLIAQYRRAVLL